MPAGRGPQGPSSTYGATRPPRPVQASGRSSQRYNRPPVPVYGSGGDLRCYMVQEDEDAGCVDVMNQEQPIDGGADTMAVATMFESSASAYAAQECELQAPYYVDQYGQAHFFG